MLCDLCFELFVTLEATGDLICDDSCARISDCAADCDSTAESPVNLKDKSDNTTEYEYKDSIDNKADQKRKKHIDKIAQRNRCQISENNCHNAEHKDAAAVAGYMSIFRQESDKICKNSDEQADNIEVDFSCCNIC